MNNRNELLARVYIVMMFFVFLTLLIVGKVFYINVIEGDKWREKISRNVKWVDVSGDRGNIYSQDGSMLAITSPIFDVRMDLLSPNSSDFNKNIDSLSFCISKYLNTEKSHLEWKNLLTNNRLKGKEGKKRGMGYFLIKRNVSYDELIKIKKFPLFNKGKIRGGLIIERQTVRMNPYKNLGYRTIGIDRINADNVGLEGAYDKKLKGEKAKRLMKKLRGGTWIPLQEIDDKPLAKGSDLVTNLNIKIQDIVHQEVLAKLHQTRAEAGVGIIMEVKTGKVVAMSNLSKNKDGAYVERLNYALKKKYAPGSVMKTATTMALLDDNHINKETLIDLEGGRKNFRGKIIKDDEDIGKGRKVKLWDVFVHSSNVGMAKWSDEFYNKNRKENKKFILKLKSFGLSKTSGIDLIGEEKPLIKDPELNQRDFYRNTVPWMAHGYEMELTPIQILTFYNAIANDGVLIKPYLVDKIISETEVIENKPSSGNKRIANNYTIKQIQELLEGVVQKGTGQKLKNKKVRISGKTGTAQAGVKKENEDVLYNSTFAGFFPSENPKYSMIISMYGNMKPMYYASQVAVPVFGNIVDKLLSIHALELVDDKISNHNYVNAGLPDKAFGYAPDFKDVLDYVEIPYKKDKNLKWSEVNKNVDEMVLGQIQFKSKLVPDVKGMGARDAVYILENMGLKVEIEGFGKVYKQSIPPKTKRNKQKIKLFLK